MRVKLVFLAGSFAAFVVALIFGADMCAQVAQDQQQSTFQGGESVGDEVGGEATDGQQAPNVGEGGVQNVNQNLREMKSGMQRQMQQRQDNLDDQLEGSGAEK
jgi:hypothetical protein